jgi:hypothetical protein
MLMAATDMNDATAANPDGTPPVALRAEATPGRIAVLRAGQPEPILVQNAAPDTRPFIHPIVAPDGRGVLTEDAPPHHPWQHGLYVGLNDVNGVGFWTEQLRRVPPGRSRDYDGTFRPAPLPAPRVAGNAVSWTVDAEWRDPRGAPLLAETQAWRLVDRGATYLLDLDWTLRAAVDLTFGQYAYGGLFIRMPYRKETGGCLLTSEGHTTTGAAEGQRARWIAISMPLPGPDRSVDSPPDPPSSPPGVHQAGVAMMDHPANPEHPVPWRVDNQLGICPSRCIAGPWRLPRGAATTSRYRLLVFTGAIDAARIEDDWRTFARL